MSASYGLDDLALMERVATMQRAVADASGVPPESLTLCGTPAEVARVRAAWRAVVGDAAGERVNGMRVREDSEAAPGTLYCVSDDAAE